MSQEGSFVPSAGDVEALARMANQFFSALPAAESPRVPVPAQPEAQLPVQAPAATLVDPAGLAASERFDVGVPDLQAFPPVYGAPKTPEVPFYFLEYARPVAGVSALTPRAAQSSAPIDVNRVRGDFPILAERVNGRPLIWFDNGATTQKPQTVIDRLKYFYEHENSNIHRAAHELAARATDAYEGAREIVRKFINARSANEIVFVRGTTEGINLVAKTWGVENIGHDDEIIVSEIEHHANIVPLAATRRGYGCPPEGDPDRRARGQIRLDEYARLLNPRCCKLVAFTLVANAPSERYCRQRRSSESAHRAGARGSSSMERNRWLICPATCRPSTPTSSFSPAIRSSLRPASACSTVRKIFSTPLVPGREAAT